MEALDDTFKFLDARGDFGWRRYRAIDSDANDLDRRESNDRYDWYEWLEVQATLPRLEPSRGCAVERIALKLRARRSPAQGCSASPQWVQVLSDVNLSQHEQWSWSITTIPPFETTPAPRSWTC